jgi:hypothetical protein
MVCSRCNSSDLRRSRWQLQDLLFLAFFFVPFRCQSCWIRSYRNVITVALRQKKTLPYIVLDDTNT